MNYYKQYEPLFGSWNFVRLIGEGSFGKVYEIERHDVKKTYKSALKAITIPASPSEVHEIMLEGMDEAAAKEYFRSVVDEVINEFDLMEQMKGNSNIVSYEDHMIVEHTDGIGWDILIRMELLSPLNKHYNENGMTKTDVILLGIDMCRALEVCKRNDIVHRDIKPENIFVSANGDYKLGDFGVAKSMENANNSFSKKGTCFYMAPEVYKGKKYDWRVDIYSVGLVMYRYLNDNVMPFFPRSAESITYKKKEEALERRMSGEPLPLPVVVDDELFSVIRRACAYYPQDRYSSPSDMRRELERILTREESIDNLIDDEMFDKNSDETDEELASESSDERRKNNKPKKIAAIIAAVLVVAAAVLAVVFTNKKQPEAPTQTQTASEQSATVAQTQSVSAVQSTTVPASVSETVTELTTELTTVPDIFYDGYVAPVPYNAGRVQNDNYYNEWAGIRIDTGSGYKTNGSNLGGLTCLFKMSRLDTSTLSVFVEMNSASLVNYGSESYLKNELDIRKKELKTANTNVSVKVPVTRETIGDFSYNYYILERSYNIGISSSNYYGFYYRQIGEHVLVFCTVTNSVDASKALMKSVEKY